MDKERVCICTKCRSWYFVNKKNDHPECPDCKCTLFCTNISCKEFESMSDEKRETVMKSVCQDVDTDKKEIKDSSPWIILVEIVGAIAIGISVLAGIFILTSASNIALGILGFAVTVFIGIMTASPLFLFAGIASDIMAIRNKLGA